MRLREAELERRSGFGTQQILNPRLTLAYLLMKDRKEKPVNRHAIRFWEGIELLERK